MVIFFRSLNFKLIMLILGLALIQNSYILYQSLRQAEIRIDIETKNNLGFHLKHMQDSLRYLIDQGDYLQIQKEFVSLGLDPNIKLGLLLDHNNQVIASIRRAEIAKPWEQVLQNRSDINTHDPAHLQEQFALVRHSNNGRLQQGQAGNVLEGIYPVVLGNSEGSLRPDKIGILLLWQDIGILKQQVRTELLQKSIGAIFVILCSAIIMLLFITYWVVLPLDKLSVAAQHLANGDWDYTHRLPLTRSDEMGLLGQAFARMTGQLRELFGNLEAKVEERTAALEQAYAEITTLNQRLSSENIRMGTELEVTRKLQQMVLPHEYELEQITELDIACFMEPATEVGGDYYDVLQHNDRVKISIGDVTGHGLESGVLMLMVQTAVRTLLLNNVTDSQTFMSILNRVIYDNVKRMRSDKNLTLSILDYHHGKLSMTGQHEEVLLVKKNGHVQRIDTIDFGFMVGLEKDISQFFGKLEVELKMGEGIVLYTDGITEAFNHTRKVYTVERLCTVIEQHWHKTAQEVLAAIISDVRTHIDSDTLQDDITLLVIKQAKEVTKAKVNTHPRTSVTEL